MTYSGVAEWPPVDAEPPQASYNPHIFLTTLKPQQRVVTAHDIASSLYYFHVDSIHDEKIRELLGIEPHFQKDGEKENEKARPSSGGQSPNRKPLPSAPRLALEDRSESMPKAYPHFQIPLTQEGRLRLARKPVGGKDQVVGLNANGMPVTPRKLWGPRPLHARNLSVDIVTSLNDPKEVILPKAEILIPRRLSEQPPPVSPNLDINSEYDTTDSQATDFSITMIRRDPGSGGQWNVGKITSGPSATKQIDSVLSRRDSRQGRERSLLIEITNTGYNKYKCVERVSLGPEKVSLDYNSTQGTQTHNHATRNPTEYHGFCRHLFLEWPRSQSNGPLLGGNETRLSTDSTGSAQESTSNSPYPSPQLSPSYPRPYSFLSPWNGICEFSTGLAGRSLKCGHTLHSSPSSPGSKDSSSARTVSDLRFNLPSSKLLGLLFPRRLPLPTVNQKRSSFFANSHSRDLAANDGNEAEDSDDEDGARMDLSLGQEQAGGGLRGKQAKLGKLIVEDEGLKMLDLVVAANMGVWWSVCGSGFG
ncbi:hypothetical protein MMC26_005075 [Xylographa opegraphella]|nr:hypothetical protein [Xylographa opegraphella]